MTEEGVDELRVRVAQLSEELQAERAERLRMMEASYLALYKPAYYEDQSLRTRGRSPGKEPRR